MEIDEEAVEKFFIQVDKQSACSEANNLLDVNIDGDKLDSQGVSSGGGCLKEQGPGDIDVNMEEGISEHDEAMIVDCEESMRRVPACSIANVPISENVVEENDQKIDTLDGISSGMPTQDKTTLSSSSSKLLSEESETKTMQDGSSCSNSETVTEMSACISVSEGCNESPNSLTDCASPSLSIVPCNVSPVLKSPTPSVSPKLNMSRKSLRTSSMLTASQKDLMDDSKLTPEGVHFSLAKSLKRSSSTAISTCTSKNLLAPTEQLAASIRHGLEIIDSHRQSTALRRSAFRFSFKTAETNLNLPASKVDTGVQTTDEIRQEEFGEFMCISCKSRMQLEAKEAKQVNDNSDMQLVPLDALDSADKSKKQVPKVSLEVSASFPINSPESSDSLIYLFF